MDPIHHSKIADKLMQYRGKLPKHVNPSDRIAKDAVFHLKEHIDLLLWYVDKYATLESQGLI